MITTLSPNRNARGSVLLISILTLLIGSIALAGYLTLVNFQNRSVMRALAWNSAVPVAEAGIEEALTHLKFNPVGRLQANGWNPDERGWLWQTRQVREGRCRVAIEPVEPPNIYALGQVPAPLSGLAAGSFSQSAVTFESYGNAELIQRVIRVTTKRDYIFSKALVAEGDINLHGNRVTTDSFDSTNPAFSTGGMYDPAKSMAGGDVATNSGLVDSLDVGEAKIKGTVSTGPGGSVKIGPNGSVGSKDWVASGNKGIESGYAYDDMNVEFAEVQVPFTDGYSTPAGGEVGGTYYDYIIGDGQYRLSSLKGRVLVQGTATLLVTDEMQLTGDGLILLDPGASLQLYVAAENAVIGGRGVVNPGVAANFGYWGLPSNTSLAYMGNGTFTGTVYAPQANFFLKGGGAADKDVSVHYDFVGASITKTATLGGHFNFHYDESLASDGPFLGYIPTSWNEVGWEEL